MPFDIDFLSQYQFKSYIQLFMQPL